MPASALAAPDRAQISIERGHTSGVQTKRRVLMCAPTYFDIEYSINPWMHLERPPDDAQAARGWDQLYQAYKDLDFDVGLIGAVNHLPDLVFTANGGLAIDGRLMLSRFLYKERQGETPIFKEWFEEAGYRDIYMPEHEFEGEGDALLCGRTLLAGHGFRSSLESHKELHDYFDLEVVSLKLVDPRYYHVDTCLSVLDDETIMFYPAAFDAASQEKLRSIVPHVIEANDADAEAFGLNAYSDGHNVMLSDRASGLMGILRSRGFNPVGINIAEFQKAGGGVKCLTLELR